MKRIGKLVLALLLTCFSTSALAETSLLERCINDPLQEHLLEGRLRWLMKCGYLTEKKFDTYLEDRMYPGYQIPAANEPTAPCYDLGKKRGPCEAAGCYAPGQRLLFGGEYVAIEQAYALGLQTVSTLGSSDITLPLHLKEMPIASFVAGDTREDLIVLETEGGSHLKVTKGHPFFDQAGLPIIANKVVVGKTRILTLRGPELVTSAEREAYEGQVWNIKPESEEYSDNVVVAEDILTGSIRYQNQWAETTGRFLRRNGEPLDADRNQNENGYTP